MICRCIIFGGRPGFIPVREENELGTLTRYIPCPDCGGSSVVHCCDGDSACNDPPAAAQTGKERHDSRTPAAGGFSENSH